MELKEIKETNEKKRAAPAPPKSPALERVLALQLHFGTWLASGLIAAGLFLQWTASPSAATTSTFSLLSWEKLVTAGVALFIGLPVLRIATMLVAFYREKSFLFVAFALFVLTILAVSLFVAV